MRNFKQSFGMLLAALKPALMLRIGLALTCFLLLGSALSAQSMREDEDFAYIVELYYGSDAYLDEVSAELAVFSNRYPDSSYNQYIQYLQGNIALKRGEFKLSGLIYHELLEQDLHPDILADIYLNYAIANYYLGDYSLSLNLLGDLQQTAVHPWYLYQVNVWRGRIKAMQELWLSAAEEYQQALAYDPQEVLYDYFQVLLALEREEQALAILNNLPAESPDYIQYHGSWLDQLLSEGRYADFDDHVADMDSLYAAAPELTLLKVRKALDMEDYPAAKTLLQELTAPSDLAAYYRAILLNEDGYPDEADQLFKSLLHSQSGDLAVLSYLERLKILHTSDPVSATRQLERFLEDPLAKRGDAYHLLGQFKFASEDYPSALSKFIEAANFPLGQPMEEMNQIFSARCYYNIGQYELCADLCNRYLNKYPAGLYRDLAFYYNAKSQPLPENAKLARLNYERMLREHPDSPWADEARFDLAELYFQASEYAAAEALYKSVVATGNNFPSVYLRLAQTYYYQDKYDEASQILSSVLDPTADFEAALLQAGITFSQKDFAQALELFSRAENLGSTPIQKTEALSYRAYTLFYLKRFTEASDLFQELSRDSLNAEIYLYQAAKSAASGRNWIRALELYDRWLDEFTESGYYLNVLADIANTNFNLGRYSESLSDWLNILRRFTASTYVEEEDRPLLSEVFTGIETSSRKLRGVEHIDEIAMLIDTFKSDYIKFELEFILVKLYANSELWEDLLREATQFRQSLNLPSERQNEFDQLLLRSLIKLNRLEEADSLASQIHTVNPNREILVQWAELAALNGNPELALERYQRAYAISQDADVWLKMLDLSTESGWQDFAIIWSSGSQFQESYPETQLHRIGYLFDQAKFTEATALADSLLDTQANPWIRARAEIWLGRIQISEGDYQAARRSFQKIRLLYYDFPDIYSETCYYYILSLVNLDEVQEARLALIEYQQILSEKQISALQTLLENRR